MTQSPLASQDGSELPDIFGSDSDDDDSAAATANDNEPQSERKRKSILDERDQSDCKKSRLDLDSKSESYEDAYQVTMLENDRLRCDICSKSFSQLKNVKQHHDTIHVSKIKSFSCKIPGCQKKVSCQRYLNDHKRKIHDISAKATKKSGMTKPSKKVIAEEPQNVKAESIED